MRFQDSQESDIFLTENEQSIICGAKEHSRHVLTNNIQKHYLLSMTRFLTMKYQQHPPMVEMNKEDDVVDSFEAYQKSLILRFTDYNLDKPDQDILESICLLD